jgi:acyl carrier protein
MEEKFLPKLKEVLEINDRDLVLSDRFRDYEEWDSLAFLSLIAMIDEEYDVIIDGKDFKQLETVGDIMQAIKERQ